MNHITLPPPDGPMAYGKHSQFITSDSQVHRKSHGKRKRKQKPIEEHRYYLAVYINDGGELEIVSSNNVEHLEHLMQIPGKHMLNECYTSHAEVGSSRRIRRDDTNQDGSGAKASWPLQPTTAPSSDGSISYPFHNDSQPFTTHQPLISSHDQNGPRNLTARYRPSRQSPSPETFSNGSMMTELRATQTMKKYRVDDTVAWRIWLGNAFKAVQQQTCRFIAKEWIKLIHPKKQSSHPYNGNFPRSSRQCPESTRPPYWPPDIPHKEPDHINKDCRTDLLIHLLMNTPQKEITPNSSGGGSGGKEIFAAQLLEVLRKKQTDLGARWEIITTIIFARQKLEMYEVDGCDADMVLSVPDYEELIPGPTGKKARLESKAKLKNKSQSKATQSNSNVIDDGDDDDDCVPPPTRPASPPAPSEPGNEEDEKMALGTSFSSDTTQISSMSSQGTIIPQTDENMIDRHRHAEHALLLQPMMFNSTTHNNDTECDYHDQVRSRQPSTQQLWSSINPGDPRLNMPFSHDMIGTHSQPPVFSPPYEQDMFTNQRSTAADGVMPPLPPYSRSQLGFHFGHNIGEPMSYGGLNMGTQHDEHFSHPGVIYTEMFATRSQ